MSGTNFARGLEGVDPLAPAIVLVNPQLGENIGAVARAMLNCGLVDLRLVDPRPNWLNDHARAACSGADAVLDQARVFDRIEDATGDLHRLYATSARRREMVVPVFTPRAATAEMRAFAAATPPERSGILFGRERWGLNNDEASTARAFIEVPLNPGFASLNLAQAVLILAYEWRMTADTTPARHVAGTDDIEGRTSPPATQEDIYRLFEHLESELDEAGYLYPPDKRPAMVRTLRAIFQRAELRDHEVRSLRGVVKTLAHKRERGLRKKKPA